MTDYNNQDNDELLKEELEELIDDEIILSNLEANLLKEVKGATKDTNHKKEGNKKEFDNHHSFEKKTYTKRNTRSEKDSFRNNPSQYSRDHRSDELGEEKNNKDGNTRSRGGYRSYGNDRGSSHQNNGERRTYNRPGNGEQRPNRWGNDSRPARDGFNRNRDQQGRSYSRDNTRFNNKDGEQRSSDRRPNNRFNNTERPNYNKDKNGFIRTNSGYNQNRGERSSYHKGNGEQGQNRWNNNRPARDGFNHNRDQQGTSFNRNNGERRNYRNNNSSTYNNRFNNNRPNNYSNTYVKDKDVETEAE